MIVTNTSTLPERRLYTANAPHNTEMTGKKSTLYFNEKNALLTARKCQNPSRY